MKGYEESDAISDFLKSNFHTADKAEQIKVESSREKMR
jgi:hypothetical protein